MAGAGAFFVLVYILCVLGIIFLLIRLLYRFVVAQERMAAALEMVARKLKDDAKP